jgi:glycosyltransferase involved in cell wall biosynthesis
MNGPVHVCHVITRLELGGAQDNTLYTVRHLRSPFRASLACGTGGLLDAEARDLGVPVTFVPALVRELRPHRDLAAFVALTRLFRARRPDIVHTHSSKAGIIGRLAARAAGVRTIVHTIHGFGFNDAQPAAARAGLVLLERLVAPLTTRFIAVSRSNIVRGTSLGILRPGRVSLIRSGIHLRDFQAAAAEPGARAAGVRAELGIDPAAPLVGMVACLKPQKAPEDFVEVAARVATRMPAVHFVLAGDGELRDSVERRVAARGLAGRFHLLGWRRDVPRLMASLDVLVLTSLWEGLPRVIPEAFAAGVPVVATSVDGSADLLVDGVNGFRCPPRDVETLADRVARLLGDAALRRAIADRARAALPEFDIDAMVRAQEALYLELIGAPGGAVSSVDDNNNDATDTGDRAAAPITHWSP